MTSAVSRPNALADPQAEMASVVTPKPAICGRVKTGH
jgi:hypothetical protein